MDAKSNERTAAPVALISVGRIVVRDSELLDVTPFVKDRKAIKFMSKQDQLGLAAAVLCARDSGLGPDELSECGLYASVGILPFEEEYVRTLADKSQVNGRFDMGEFSASAYPALNPLLTFKCLPNMPAFHISWTLGIRGPHFLTYPGPGQWACAVERAARDIRSGRVRHALVGAIGDQNNFLARNYFERVGAADDLKDASIFWLLGPIDDQRSSHANPVARILNVSVEYENHDVFAGRPAVPARGPFDQALEIERRRESGVRGQTDLNWSSCDGLSGTLSLELLR